MTEFYVLARSSVGSGPAGLLLAAQLSEFPEIVTRVVEKADGPLQVGRADGVNCRTVEMFEAFGLAGKMTEEAYWVNETHFWGADPQDNSKIARLGRTQDVRDLLSEFPHVIVNQARLLDLFLGNMANSPSRLKVDYGMEAVTVEVPDADEPVTVTLRRSGAEGEELAVRARYVVGCDGAHSLVIVWLAKEGAKVDLHAVGRRHASAGVNGLREVAMGLRDRLVGAWKLVSYQEVPVDGSEPFEPLGHEPHGIIMYTPDGYMSAQLAKPDRPHFASGDWFAGTVEDYRSEATSYIAYSGPFHVDEDNQTLTPVRRAGRHRRSGGLPGPGQRQVDLRSDHRHRR